MDIEQNVFSGTVKEDKKVPKFSSKWLIGIAMFVLGAGLALTVTTVASINKESLNNFQTRSLAVDNVSQRIPFPSLPAGCEYNNANDAVSVDCSGVFSGERMPKGLNLTMPPIPSVAVPLPDLPSECKYQSSVNGMSVDCPTLSGFPQISIPPIPTVMVPIPSLPQSCQKTMSSDGGVKVTCSSNSSISLEGAEAGQNVTRQTEIDLPPLPAGCNYVQGGNGSTSVQCDTGKLFEPKISPALLPSISLPTISVSMPVLPQNCAYETTSAGGQIVRCSSQSSMSNESGDTVTNEIAEQKEVMPELDDIETENQPRSEGLLGVLGSIFKPFTDIFASLFGNR